MSANALCVPPSLRSSLRHAAQHAATKRADLRDVSAVPTFTAGYTPSAKQRLLHESTAANLLYGGAAGGGKSRGFREDMRLFALSTPKANILLLRRTHTELRDNHRQPAMLEWHADGARFNTSENVVTFGNGARVIMGHCHNDGDVMRYLGQEYDRVYFDELTTFTETMYDMVCSRLRSAKPGLIPRAVAGTNPGGVGHAWVKRRWIDRDPVKADGTELDLSGYDFIQAKLSDNPIIDTPEYRARLQALSDAKRKAYLGGSWDIFEGQFFPEWSADLHVIDPFTIPELWPRVFACDYGSSAPFSGVWLAADPGTEPMNVYVYRNYHRAGLGIDQNAANCAALSEGERYRARVGDPSMWASDRTDRGSLADQAGRHGLYLEPAFNDRRAGWELIRQLLRIYPDGPRLRVFRNCVDLIRTLPSLVYDARNVEDCDTHGDDHDADALRYAVCELFGLRRAKPGEKQAASAGVQQMASRRFGGAWS